MKVLVIGDLHWGEKGNSEKYNQQVLRFINWAAALKDEYGTDTCIQLGDWYHQRNKIDVNTLNYGIEGAKILEDAFGKENFYILLGNHCLYYHDRLDVNSLSVIEPYATVVDEPISIGYDIVIAPWVANEEHWNQTIMMGKTHRFLFGHFEFNGFKVSGEHLMEHGISHRELRDYDTVFSGHFHNPQTKDNVLYTGTPYPITMNEADEDHGVYILDTETGDIEFVVYEGVKVVTIPYTDIDSLDQYDPENTSIRIEFPDSLEDDSIIEETMEKVASKKFGEVKVKYNDQRKSQILDSDTTSVEEMENIDQFVVKSINGMTEVPGVDKNMLGELYKAAKVYAEENQ